MTLATFPDTKLSGSILRISWAVVIIGTAIFAPLRFMEAWL